jgi:hypothetical protein
MASIALMGLLTGFAKGASERIEKEREENEELIRSRLKLAAVNKQKRDVETSARKKELMDRYSTISPYLDGSESEEQKLALLSNDVFAKGFVEKKSAGEVVDLDAYIQRNQDKLPKNFSTVQKYIDSISTTLEPVAPEQMQAALGEQRGFMGARTGVSPGRAERIARTMGSGASAAELLAYEQPATSAGDPLMDYARFGTITAEESFKTLESKAQKLRLKRIKEQDPDKRAMLDDEIDVTEQSMLAHKEATTARTPEQKQRTVADITSSTNRYVNTRMQQKYGNDWLAFSEEKTQQLPDGTVYTFRGVKTDMPKDQQDKLFADMREFARRALIDNRFIVEGVPVYDSVREVMNNFGITGFMTGTAATRTATGASVARPAAGAPPAASSQQTRTRAQVEAVAKARSVPYDVAKRAAEAQGIRVVD